MHGFWSHETLAHFGSGHVLDTLACHASAKIVLRQQRDWAADKCAHVQILRNSG